VNPFLQGTVEPARSLVSQQLDNCSSQVSGRSFLRAPKIDDLPTFNPDSDSILPSAYLERLQEDCRLYGIPVGEVLPVLPRIMKGAARMWIDNHLHQLRSFEDFKVAFLRNFQNEQIIQRKLTRLRNTRYRSDTRKSLREFFWEQVKAFKELSPSMSETEILSNVKNMLPIRIQRQLIGVHLRDTEELSMILWDSEELDRLEHYQRDQKSSRGAHRGGFNQQRFRPSNVQYIHSQPPSTSTRNRPSRRTHPYGGSARGGRDREQDAGSDLASAGTVNPEDAGDRDGATRRQYPHRGSNRPNHSRQWHIQQASRGQQHNRNLRNRGRWRRSRDRNQHQATGDPPESDRSISSAPELTDQTKKIIEKYE